MGIKIELPNAFTITKMVELKVISVSDDEATAKVLIGGSIETAAIVINGAGELRALIGANGVKVHPDGSISKADSGAARAKSSGCMIRRTEEVEGF